MNRDYMFYVRDGANCWGLTHALWLMDQVLLTASQSGFNIARKVFLFSDGTARGEDEPPQQLPSTARVIDTIKIENLIRWRGWNFRPALSPDNGSAGQGAGGANQDGGPLEDRLELLHWVLEPSKESQDEFGKSVRIFEARNEQILRDVWSGFKRLTGLLLHNVEFGPQLDAILTTDFTLSARLVKLKFEYEKTFEEFDALKNALYRQGANHVVEYAEKLRGHADNITNLYIEWGARKPGHVWYMAGLLLEILFGVVTRDFNMYGNSQQTGGNDSSMGNLYVRLVRGQQLFVVGTLDAMHASILKSHQPSFDSIRVCWRRVDEDDSFASTFNRVLEKASLGP
ncbi:hypothetical protein DIS24_g10732 [Lasiodiplodia hormozganensis]|nr:hypothetical protein DIS24_g10732 [Lasiodiplodia hormozganensis]